MFRASRVLDGLTVRKHETCSRATVLQKGLDYHTDKRKSPGTALELESRTIGVFLFSNAKQDRLIGGILVGVWNGWGHGMAGGMELHFFGL